MTEYVDMGDVTALIETLLGTTDIVRDWGSLESAVHRPQSIVFGEDVYPDLHTKAASLLESITRNHPLLDGNKRLGLTAVSLFYFYNGFELRFVDAAEGDRFVRSVATGDCPLAKSAETLHRWVSRREDR